MPLHTSSCLMWFNIQSLQRDLGKWIDKLDSSSWGIRVECLSRCGFRCCFLLLVLSSTSLWIGEDWERERKREGERVLIVVCVCYICVTHGETVSTEPGEFWFLIERGDASRGYIAISVDSRYHGERATNTTTYIDVQ